MKISRYFKDKIIYILPFIVAWILTLLLLIAFKVDKSCVVVILGIWFLLYVVIFVVDFFRKNDFYKNLNKNIEELDKSYLVLETLNKPGFYEGELLYEALYEIDKSMIENVNQLGYQVKDFKEYIEMWIHEVKIPLSALALIVHNHKSDFDKKTIEQIERINSYVEQVLYYTRSENAEKDYQISEVNIAKVVKKVALKNKDYLLENQIDFITEELNVNVLSDAKWIEFILNQIVNNSIKYRKDKDSYIKIYSECSDKSVRIFVEDNGIGILKSDIGRVFEKSFTGYNGRIKSKSTGMGLFIAQKLCRKLEHKISIESEVNEFTRVCITFVNNNYYKGVR